MKRLKKATLAAVVLTLLLACGCTDSADTDKTEGEFGEATMVLTDAASDDIAVFEVDVTQLTLTKLNNAVVHTLPRRQRVDFAQLADISQLLVGVRLTAGFYKNVTITLDFSSANIWLKDAAGPATVYDADGVELTGTVEVDVLFGQNNRPNIIVRRNRLFVFDLNLDASVSVDTGSNSVTFNPIITATVDPSNPKPIITTGKLVGVDTSNAQIILSVHNPRTGEEVGQYTIQTGLLTVFQVDGVPSGIFAGLAALAAKPAGTRVFAHGIVDRENRVLLAGAIEAGYGVPGNGQDWCQGLIVARTGGPGEDPTLTLRGCTFTESTRAWSFNQVITVQADSSSAVLRRARNAVRTTDDLNIGQRITAYGDLAGNAMDATGSAHGVVRCIRTDIFGFAAGPAAAGQLTVNLSRIGLRPIGLFDFSVDGTAQADPAAFVVDIGTLNVSTVDTGTPLKIRGFLAPVAAAPSGADLTAEMVIDRNAVGSLLVCEWRPASAFAVSQATDTGLTLDLTGTYIAKVDHGFVGMVDLNTAAAAQVVPKYDLGVYVISLGKVNEVYLSFAEFSAALTEKLDTAAVFQIFALGHYAPGTQTLSSGLVVIVLR